MPKSKETDERADERKRYQQARLDELDNNPGQVGPGSASQSGDPQSLPVAEESQMRVSKSSPIPIKPSNRRESKELRMPPIILGGLLTPTMNTLGRMTFPRRGGPDRRNPPSCPTDQPTGRELQTETRDAACHGMVAFLL
jgi:hypothetical protein